MNRKTDAPARIEAWRARFEERLEGFLAPIPGAPAELSEAMRYSALAGGKRMRPMLVYGAGDALGLDCEDLHAVAAAVELIHAYSLIHDDLPAMDDDDLRRGRPTCHRRFGEATAILAGDALQALAFEVLATDPVLARHPGAQVRVIGSIARACGAGGMAGGQVLDLAAVDQEIGLEALETMHRLKTGALIRVSARAPALVARAPDVLAERLTRYGARVGLAFQIHDDLLDVTSSSEQTGKPVHGDAARNKPAFPSVIGLEASRRRARELCARAVDELHEFPGDTSVLEWLARYAIQRES